VTGVELRAEVMGVTVDARAAGPTLVFDLALAAEPPPVYAIALQVRVAIDAARRRYSADEQARLLEVFGRPHAWRDNLHPVVWADVATTVPAFEREATIGLRVPCTYDMEVASAKYFGGVAGDVPLQFFFSGTAFVPGPAGIAVVRLPREMETSWRMPASAWHDAMDAYFPGWRWVRLSPGCFDALARYKAERALATWDAVVEDLLGAVNQDARARA
jgi:hypothetical protein